MREQNTARHGTDHRFNICVLELLRHRRAELRCVFRMLKHVELLDIVRAVQPRGQQEMSVHDRARLHEQGAYLLLRHHTDSISFKISSAAARGFSAA